MNKEQLTILLQANGEMARRIIAAGDHETHLNMSLRLCKLINDGVVTVPSSVFALCGIRIATASIG
jgi:hypothetical protein